MKKTVKLLSLILVLVTMLSLFCIPVSAASSVGKVKNLHKVEIEEDEIEISWNRVSGAKGYKIYVRKLGETNWVHVKTVYGTRTEVKNLEEATGYQFRVRAYRKSSGKTVNGSYSSILTTATDPDEVRSLTATAVSGGKTKLTWSSVNGADGYKVYRKTSSGTWKKVKTTSSTSATLSASTGTRFKVRAYHKSNGKTYTGDSEYVTVPKTNPVARRISETEAKNIALKDAGFSESQITKFEIELDRENRIYVYEIEFRSGNYKYEYEINADTGEIICSEREYKR